MSQLVHSPTRTSLKSTSSSSSSSSTSPKKVSFTGIPDTYVEKSPLRRPKKDPIPNGFAYHHRRAASASRSRTPMMAPVKRTSSKDCAEGKESPERRSSSEEDSAERKGLVDAHTASDTEPSKQASTLAHPPSAHFPQQGRDTLDPVDVIPRTGQQAGRPPAQRTTRHHRPEHTQKPRCMREQVPDEMDGENEDADANIDGA